MNCTDQIGAGLTLIVGSLWLDAMLLPGAGIPLFGFGLGYLAVGLWRAGRLVTQARGGGRR
ncbi:hypothetical protein [Verrucosispora sp. WMMC514]|uniref:hypothetical protein n=1 Tax=Verrucosispora sp. WMMC514 TaxID=3015156 RepID=UPI00248C302F|nr:hypothetical protein [Verrucosispora sp. WMMC514]WBB94257.1 hypothetical protein O7597_15510 [Verrucosispora sp. WMMC514]